MAEQNIENSTEFYPPPVLPGGLTGIRGPIIATWTLALVVIFLRFASRKVSRAGFWYDDWFMIPSIVRDPSLLGFPAHKY